MKLRDLRTGTHFKFEPHGYSYEARGNGWYGRPYSGGPWHVTAELDRDVIASWEIALDARSVREAALNGIDLHLRCRFPDGVHDCAIRGAQLKFPTVYAIDNQCLSAEFAWQTIANGARGALLLAC